MRPHPAGPAHAFRAGAARTRESQSLYTKDTKDKKSRKNTKEDPFSLRRALAFVSVVFRPALARRCAHRILQPRAALVRVSQV